MIIKIDRDLKIRLIKALQSGVIDTNLFPEFRNVETPKYDFSYLTDEERDVLLKVADHILDQAE